MSEAVSVPISTLRKMSPFDCMKQDNLVALSRKVTIESIPAGRTLFREGERDAKSYWLLAGSIEFLEGDKTVAITRAGTADAKGPLVARLPRRATARTLDPCQVLVVNTELLDMMITWDQTGQYEVGELNAHMGVAEGSDWMTTLLQSRTFQHIPASNIQSIFMSLQRVVAHAGDVMIQQGAEGDYFYIIVSGKCSVTRESPVNRSGLLLAELGAGDTFGEEALISETKRNATVTMLTDGVLMRLAKQDFRQYINEPLTHWVSFEEAQRIVAAGGRWLDVRLPSEYQQQSLPDSINIPLYFIRLKLSTLEPNRDYVVYCDTGRRSAAAAYIMVDRGFHAYVLTGGIDSAESGVRRVG